MKPIAISLSPNIQLDDLKIVIKTLSLPWQWPHHQTRAPQIEKTIATITGHRYATLTNSGRVALYQTLKAYDIGAGDEVIIQAFTCLAVTNAVNWTGATVRYADINPATYNLDPASVKMHLTTRTRALIIQHTFGIPADIKQLQVIAKAHNLILIEDLAHGLGGTYNNQPLGSYGDAAILSFGRDKIISSVFGGAIATSNEAVKHKLEQLQQHQINPPAWWIVQQLLHPILMSVIVPLYFTAGSGKALLIAAQKIHLLSKAVAPPERRGQKPVFFNFRYPPAFLPLLTNQLAKLNMFTNHRRHVAAAYLAAFPNKNLAPYSNHASWLRFPLRREKNIETLTTARAHGLLLGDWYQAPITPPTPIHITHYQPGSCPNAEQAATHIINLPTHPRLKTSDIKRIITYLT